MFQEVTDRPLTLVPVAPVEDHRAKFIGFLRSYPASKPYDYSNPLTCAMGLFLGRRATHEDERRLINNKHEVICGMPRTFGGVLERLTENHDA